MPVASARTQAEADGGRQQAIGGAREWKGGYSLPRRQFLWIDPRGAECFYQAAGNVNIGAGSKGTLAVWQWPVITHVDDSIYWRIEIDGSNYMRQFRGRTFRVCSQGSVKDVSLTNVTSVYEWEHLVYTWDFTTPGAGVMRVYYNGQLTGTPVTNANAPVGTPTRIAVGAPAGVISYGAHALNSLAIWDDVVTSEQVTALYAMGARGRIRPEDGPGTMTLYAHFDGQYDAQIAAGDGTFYAPGAQDRYCLVDDGARHQGRLSFLLGMPRHDLSEDDRVPLSVPWPLNVDAGRAAYLQDINEATYADLRVLAGYTQSRRVGAYFAGTPVFDARVMNPPCTYRQRLHIPMADTPMGRVVRIGPVDYVHYPTGADNVFDQWGSGRRLTVVADAGNTTTQFKTDLGAEYGTNYWAGAMITFLGSNCGGRRLKVASYDATTRVITLESALPAVPAAGSIAVVDFRARIQGCRSYGSTSYGTRMEDMSTDAWLWEFHGDSRLFTELEWQFVGANSAENLVPNMLRYDRGRTVYMDGANHSTLDWGACYGKPSVHEDNTLSCRVLLERVELDGPTTYQRLRRGPAGDGPDFADNFMVVAGNGQSTKVWRSSGVARQKTRPTKCQAPAAAKADLCKAGTWRETVGSWPIPVCYDESRQEITALLTGTGPDGVARLGYVVGSWDAVTGRIKWVDEVPPAGKSNPFMAQDDLRPAPEGDGPVSSSYPTAVLQGGDGLWSLVYIGQTSHPDHFMAYLLTGAEDRWSFSREEHFWRGNPISPIIGGAEPVLPDGNASSAWANRDAGWRITDNPYATDESRRFVGYARGKSINHRSYNYALDMRPLIGIQGGDLRSMRPLPHGNMVSPLPAPLVHSCDVAVLGQSDCIGLYSDTATAATSGVYCYVSEDGIHFQTFASHSEWLPQGQLPGEPTRLGPGRPFQLGDRRVYYYGAGDFVNFGWVRLDGEAWYELQATATSGFFETPILERPVGGWGTLRLNSTQGAGSVRVEVVDAETEEVLPGFSAADCDALGDSVNAQVRWGGVLLSSLTMDAIRLRFVLSRHDAGAETPRVYAWRVRRATAIPPPVVGSLKVEGETNPIAVLDPAPELSWEYADPSGYPQTAYRVLVATSRDKLAAGLADVWDSGVVESDATRVTLSAVELASNKVYFWRVQARNSQGVWSAG